MDIILQVFTPILTAGIQATIIPIIEKNLEKLDSIEGDINQKLDELAKDAKTGIDKLPDMMFGFKGREKTLSELPFEKVDQLLDKLDLSAIDEIKITPIIDDKGVDKTPEIKAKLTQFPNKIREKLKASIRAVLLPGAVAGNMQVTETKKTEAPADATTPLTAEQQQVLSEEKTESIVDGLKDLTEDEKDAAFNTIMNLLKKTGILKRVQAEICKDTAAPPAILPNEPEQPGVDNMVEPGEKVVINKEKTDEKAEAIKKADEEAEAKKKAEEAEAKKKADEAEAKKKADEEAEAKKKADEEAKAEQEAAEKAAKEAKAIQEEAEEAAKKEKTKQEEAEEAAKKAKAKQEEAEEAAKKAKAIQEEAEEAAKKAKSDQEALDNEITKSKAEINALKKEITEAEAKEKSAGNALDKSDDIRPATGTATAAGGANKKHRRKTKKNIRRQKRTYTKFGRNF